LFIEGKVDRVDILFTNFISTLTQKPEALTLLPVGEIKGVTAGIHGHALSEKLMKGATEFMFEPSAEQVLENLLPHYINFQVYQILMESKASEHSARMVAMKNATDNAQQLIKDLTIEYNKLRQTNITKELLEIATAQMAMG
jgi:F-type H+-transporting ATPase subunit gamma